MNPKDGYLQYIKLSANVGQLNLSYLALTEA